MAYEFRGPTELWVRADSAREEASVLLDTLVLRLEISHAVLRECAAGLTQT